MVEKWPFFMKLFFAISSGAQTLPNEGPYGRYKLVNFEPHKLYKFFRVKRPIVAVTIKRKMATIKRKNIGKFYF